MKKSGLDERQERIMEEIGAKSFTVMFLVCAAVIVGELAWSGDLGSVAGETAVLAAGGIIYMAGCMKNGIWTKSGRKMTLGQNILLSVIFSGIFSAAYAFMIARKTADGVNVARIAGLFLSSSPLSVFYAYGASGSWHGTSMRKRKTDARNSKGNLCFGNLHRSAEKEDKKSIFIC